jgi:hypothetical protein
MEVVSKDKIEQWILPHLSKGIHGTKVGVELGRIVAAILFILLLISLLIGNPTHPMMTMFSVNFILITILYYALSYCCLFENKINVEGMMKWLGCALTANVIELTIANLIIIR